MITPRELATVLAALRYWQQDLQDCGEDDVIDAFHFTEESPLSVEEVDELCERLNLGEEPDRGAQLLAENEQLKRDNRRLTDVADRCREMCKKLGKESQASEKLAGYLVNIGHLNFTQGSSDTEPHWYFTTWPVEKGSCDPIDWPQIPF